MFSSLPEGKRGNLVTYERFYKIQFSLRTDKGNVVHRNSIVFCVTFLRRALKKKGNTPKYGLIFHSSFIGRAGTKNKGRISRYLANKCSIASRIDCFSGNIKSGEVHKICPDCLHLLLKYLVGVPVNLVTIYRNRLSAEQHEICERVIEGFECTVNSRLADILLLRTPR